MPAVLIVHSACLLLCSTLADFAVTPPNVLLQYLTWSGQTTNNSFFTETGPGSAYALYTNHIGVMANRTVSGSIIIVCLRMGLRG